MVKMNWERARGGDDDFAAVGEEPTIAARYAGTCATCGQRFVVGDPIASVIVDKRPTYHHGACRYPATALLSQKTTEADVDTFGAARNEPKPGTCSATTKKGKPCNNAPQNGEEFCGPHLTQAAARAAQGRHLTDGEDTSERHAVGDLSGTRLPPKYGGAEHRLGDET